MPTRAAPPPPPPPPPPPRLAVARGVGNATPALPRGAAGRLHEAQHSSRNVVAGATRKGVSGYQRRIMRGTVVATSPSELRHESTVVKVVQPGWPSVHDVEAPTRSLSPVASAPQNGQWHLHVLQWLSRCFGEHHGSQSRR